MTSNEALVFQGSTDSNTLVVSCDYGEPRQNATFRCGGIHKITHKTSISSLSYSPTMVLRMNGWNYSALFRSQEEYF